MAPRIKSRTAAYRGNKRQSQGSATVKKAVKTSTGSLKSANKKNGRQITASLAVRRVISLAAGSDDIEQLTLGIVERNKHVSSHLSSMSDNEKLIAYQDIKNLFTAQIEENFAMWLAGFFKNKDKKKLKNSSA